MKHKQQRGPLTPKKVKRTSTSTYLPATFYVVSDGDMCIAVHEAMMREYEGKEVIGEFRMDERGNAIAGAQTAVGSKP